MYIMKLADHDISCLQESAGFYPNYQSHLTPLLFRHLSLFILLYISGCAHLSDAPVATPAQGKPIAVMPLDNETNSVAGALYMREQMVTLLKQKGYAPLPIDQTDVMLANQFGISLGGQISEVDIPKIAAGLGVDAVMTGRLKNFSAVLLSYNEVSASFTLYTGNDWQPKWTYDGVANAPFSPLRNNDSLGTQIIGGLISNVLERSMGEPLQDAVAKYYQQLQHSLPTGRDTFH